MAAAVARMPRADSRPRSKARAQADAGQAEELRFEIVPLNDDMRYASAYQALSNRTGSGHSELTSDGDSFGAAEGFLKEADDSWASQLEEKRANLSEELLRSVRDDLDNGLPARRIRQRLEPRLFVIDFDTRARAQRDGREISRPPSTRVLLDTLREQVNFLLQVASPVRATYRARHPTGRHLTVNPTVTRPSPHLPLDLPHAPSRAPSCAAFPRALYRAPHPPTSAHPSRRLHSRPLSTMRWSCASRRPAAL